ncbi:MAG TPA: hypothetical protein VK960_02560 [Acidimicrobiia bacterium]|nr:hypothetical protein [Acidimicrobiia bacterium]
MNEFDRLSDTLRSEADATDFSDLTEPAVALAARRRRTWWLRTRAATVAAGLVLGLASFGGAAYAANGSAPGDAWFWLDQFAESVGLFDGGAAERLAEVESLVGNGNTAQGIQHAAATIVGLSEGVEEATDALLAAANRVAAAEGLGEPQGIADLLTYLSENLEAVDGPTVASLARLIAQQGPPDGVPVVDPPDPETPPTGDPGPPDGVPPGPPTTGTTVP